MENVCNAMLNGLNEKLQLIEWNWIEYAVQAPSSTPLDSMLVESYDRSRFETRASYAFSIYKIMHGTWNKVPLRSRMILFKFLVCWKMQIFPQNYTEHMIRSLGPTQVKCRLLSYSIFLWMMFQHILEMLEFKLQHFPKYAGTSFIKKCCNLKVDIWLEVGLI